jgi:Zn-finger nucleic acid-binding protein
MTNDPTAATALRCPKCNAPMRSYERNGLHVDRCTECGGLFLDRGELERLVEAEAGYYGASGPAPVGPSPGRPDSERADWRRDDGYYPSAGYDPRDRYGRREDWDDDDDDRRGGRRGFLDDLFDFG